MSRSFHNVRADRECTNKCKSLQHVFLAISSITKRNISDRQLAAYLHSLCCNVGKIHDEYGRTALHMASSCGRCELALWLISVAKSDINARDFESGYTPLHRSLFYGHVKIAVKLIKMGANFNLMDHEYLTPIDIITQDRASKMKLTIDAPCQVYIWGSNKNYTIGTGTANARKHPKLLNQFGKNTISIKQVTMDEFHSVFVSSCGRVWTCGLGMGGRLGTGTEKPALIPLPVRWPSAFSSLDYCLTAHAALNHTLLLLASGTVMAFGLNSHHQLGIVPYAESWFHPRSIWMGAFNGAIAGICAARYHSVFYTRQAVFACGTNGGQLGSLDTTHSIVVTTPVQILQPKGDTIQYVSSSTGAIVVVTNKGNIYCIHQYQCRKIIRFTRHKIVKLCVIGGILEPEVIPEAMAEELKIAVLTSHGEILIWDQKPQHLLRCELKMRVSVSDICLTNSSILYTTKNGKAFEGIIKDKIAVKNLKYDFAQPDKFYIYRIDSKRLLNVHRAVAISADPKGNNFAVIQVHPRSPLTQPRMSASEMSDQLKFLLEEASVDDCLHDVVFSVGNQLFPAHRYILSLTESTLSEMAMAGGTVVIEDVTPYFFKQILLFMYTGQNEILVPGAFPLSVEGYKDDPLKELNEICVKFKIQQLSMKLSSLRFVDGLIILKEGCAWRTYDKNCQPQMSRYHSPELYDIKLQATDGIVIDAHKCVLISRLHYFQSMLSGCWAETASPNVLKLQFQSSVLKDLIDFLYTEKVPDSLSPDDLEHTVSLVIAADQLFVNSLREACERVICEALTLSNAGTLLQLSLSYNMEQLKVATMEFMCLNLNAILESRLLETFEDKILDEFNNFYRNYMKRKFSTRIVTPFTDAPSDEIILEAAPIVWPENLEEILNETSNTETKKSKNVHNLTKKRTGKKLIHDPPTEEIEEVEQVIIPQIENNLEAKPKPQFEAWSSSSSQFPALDSNVRHEKSTFKISPSNKKIFAPKLSQKQKKKMANNVEVKVESPPTPKFKGWGKIPDLPPESVNNIWSDNSNEKKQQFSDIVASEKEERNNWIKMKEKLFTLTQIEDKAMEDLLDFYNANNISDERITIQRVLPSNVAKPTWIKSHRQT